jgi:hypothetical protein
MIVLEEIALASFPGGYGIASRIGFLKKQCQMTDLGNWYTTRAAERKEPLKAYFVLPYAPIEAIVRHQIAFLKAFVTHRDEYYHYFSKSDFLDLIVRVKVVISYQFKELSALQIQHSSLLQQSLLNLYNLIELMVRYYVKEDDSEMAKFWRILAAGSSEFENVLLKLSGPHWKAVSRRYRNLSYSKNQPFGYTAFSKHSPANIVALINDIKLDPKRSLSILLSFDISTNAAVLELFTSVLLKELPKLVSETPARKLLKLLFALYLEQDVEKVRLKIMKNKYLVVLEILAPVIRTYSASSSKFSAWFKKTYVDLMG